MKKLWLSLLAGASILGVQAAGTWNLNGTNYSVDTIYHATVGPGITETHVKVRNKSTGGNANNLYYTTVDLNTSNLELRGVLGVGSSKAQETVPSMGNRMNKQGTGQYITGINADFFNMGGNPIIPNGAFIANGKLHNPYTALGWNSYVYVDGKKDISMTENLTVQTGLTFPDGTEYPFHTNSGRYNDYLCVYSRSFGTTTATNEWGAELTMKLVSGSLGAYNAVFEVTGNPVGDLSGSKANGNMAIPSNGYVLSGVGKAYQLVKSLKPGDRLSVGPYVLINGAKANPSQVLGGCPLIVINGAIAPAEAFTRIDHFSSNQARTAIGYNKDKSKLIMLVDDKFSTANSSRPAYGTSAGFTLKMIAHVMLNLGCHNAMNFDGGGSSQLYVKELGIRNIPYGSISSLRQVANGFFAVSTTPVDNTISSIEVVQKNVKLNKGGKFTPTVYGFNKYGVLVNKNVTGFTVKAAKEIGTVSGTTLTAGSGKYSTNVIVTYGNLTCTVPVYTNGGGSYVSSETPVVKPATLTEVWKFSSSALNDGWDGAAPNWNSSTAIKSKGCTRFATARDGKIYTVNMKTMSIAEITAGGIKDVYKLPSLAGRTVNGTPDYYGTAISSDDAGNFLIGHLFTKPESNLVWTVYSPATGKAKHIELTIPKGMTVKRLDAIGRVVGDLTRDALVYIAPNAFAMENTHATNQKVHIVRFNGNGDVDNVTVSDSWSPMIYLASTNNWNICQPKYATVSETLAHPLQAGFYSASCMDNNGVSSAAYFGFTDTGEDWSISWLKDAAKAATNGFDTFVLDGKRYFVRNHTDNYTASTKSTMDIAVFDETGKMVATWTNPDYYSNFGYSSIVAEVTDAKNANIYVYNSTSAMKAVSGNGGGAAAMLRFSLGEVELPTAANPALIEEWKYFSTGLNDGWDGTAPSWSTPGAIKAKGCTRFATGHDGKLYTVNMKTMSIAEITQYGMRDVYKLPSLEGVTVNGNPDYYGTAISTDDAGNFLIGHLFTKPESNLVWTVYSPSAGKARNFTLTLPAGMTVKRLDTVGRVVGDLTHDAIVYIAPNAFAAENTHTKNQKVHIVRFRGDGNVNNIKIEDTWSPMIYLAATNNWNVCQPKYATITETLAHPLQAGFYSASCMDKDGASTSTYFGFTDTGEDWSISWLKDAAKAATNGFDTFTLGDKRYFVRNHTDKYTDSTKSTMDIAVFDETGKKVATWTNPDYTSGLGYSSITARRVDDNNVYIYVYNSTSSENHVAAGAGAAALLRFSIGELKKTDSDYQVVDVTPAGLDFDNYSDGEPFVITPSVVVDAANATSGPWSNRAWTSRDDNPTAFDKNGQLTVALFRGQTAKEYNNADYIANKLQPNVTVRKVDDIIGNCLVLNQAWSPGFSTKGWDGIQYCMAQTQFSFYLDKDLVYDRPDDKQIHYIRVRLVYNILKRGCHDYLDDNKINGASQAPMIYGIYATCDQNWVVPANDADLAANFADYGKDFARWENETRNPDDIPADPVIMDPEGMIDLWDQAHETDDPNGGRNYIMNTERFRVYEFDVPLDPAHGTISVQVNTRNRNSTFLFKEIKFFDLGTDVSRANLLGKRQRSWLYFEKGGTTGVRNIHATIQDGEYDFDSTPEYYNLQGVRIENPTTGLYIVKRGNTVTKEYVR